MRLANRASGVPGISLLFAVAAACLVNAPAGAQDTATLQLVVVEAGAGSPVPGAVVSLVGEDRSALTDAEGSATLVGLPLRSLQIEVRRIGYETELLRLEPVAGEVRTATVSLRLAPVVVPGVAATAERRNRYLDSQGFYERQRVGLGRYREREHFQRLAQSGTRLSDGLIGIGGGLVVRRTGRSQHIASSRGGCASQVFLDGIPLAPEILPNGRRAPPNIDAIISPHQVEAVEWYSGAGSVPQRFSQAGFGPTNPACGVLLIWTRSGR